MKVDAGSVKKLREQTGAGVLDCKKALEKSNGVFEAAAGFLQECDFEFHLLQGLCLGG